MGRAIVPYASRPHDPAVRSHSSSSPPPHRRLGARRLRLRRHRDPARQGRPAVRGREDLQTSAAAAATRTTRGHRGFGGQAEHREYKDGPNFNVRREQYKRRPVRDPHGGFFSSGPDAAEQRQPAARAQIVACFVATYSGKDAKTPPSPGGATTAPQSTSDCKQQLALASDAARSLTRVLDGQADPARPVAALRRARAPPRRLRRAPARCARSSTRRRREILPESRACAPSRTRPAARSRRPSRPAGNAAEAIAALQEVSAGARGARPGAGRDRGRVRDPRSPRSPTRPIRAPRTRTPCCARSARSGPRGPEHLERPR